MPIKRPRTRRLIVLRTSQGPADVPVGPGTHERMPDAPRAAPHRAYTPTSTNRPVESPREVEGVLHTAYSVFDDYLDEGRRFARRHELSRPSAEFASERSAADVSTVLTRLAREIVRPNEPLHRTKVPETRYQFEAADDDDGGPRAAASAPASDAYVQGAGFIDSSRTQSVPVVEPSSRPAKLIDTANVNGNRSKNDRES